MNKLTQSSQKTIVTMTLEQLSKMSCEERKQWKIEHCKPFNGVSCTI